MTVTAKGQQGGQASLPGHSLPASSPPLPSPWWYPTPLTFWILPRGSPLSLSALRVTLLDSTPSWGPGAPAPPSQQAEAPWEGGREKHCGFRLDHGCVCSWKLLDPRVPGTVITFCADQEIRAL